MPICSFARPNLNLSRWRLVILASVCLAVAGCGSGSDKDKIRDVATHTYDALASDHPEAACKYTVDEKGCLRGVITIKVLRMSTKDLLPGDWRSTIQHAPIHLNASHTTASMQIKPGQTTTFQKVSGHWLVNQSSSVNASASSVPTPTTTDSTPTTTTAAPATSSTGLTAQERDALNNDIATFNAASRRGDDAGAAIAATNSAADVAAIAHTHRETPLEGQLTEMSNDLTAISDAITHHDQAALNQAEAKLQQLTSTLGHT